MTHRLTLAMAAYSPDWLKLNLQSSYTRVVGGQAYVVVADQTGPLAVFRCLKGKRFGVVRVSTWPDGVCDAGPPADPPVPGGGR